MSSEGVIRRADPHTVQNKVLVGYQGWFTCAGDGPPVHQGHHGWLHWFDKPLTEGGRPNFDLFPDVSEYAPDELYPVPGLSISSGPSRGEPAKLFSSRNPKTVQRHFNWMAQHGIDGAFLQRFATQCEVDGNLYGTTADLMRLRDEVLDVVRAAAERENRVWAVMYDVTGVPAERIEHVLRVDWDHLVRDKRILDSPFYLKERGMPVIAIWGFGFAEAHHDPSMVARIARHLKSVTPGSAYLWAGVPSQWRTLSGDMDPNPAFLNIFKNEFDALSPWTIGRYSKLDEIDRFCEERMAGDFRELKDLPHRVDYFPTIWPGGSSYNLSSGRLALNDAPRQGGRFFWRQLWNIKHLGARTAYIAMFDEYDEGTAVLPAIPLKRSLPICTDPARQFPFIALDADGVDNLMPDWYLRICGFAGEAMRDERRVFEELPRKELDDYWATRPKYEERAGASGSGGGGGSAGGSAYHGVESAAAVVHQQVPASSSGGGSASGSSASAPAGRVPPVRSNTGAWGAFGLDETDEALPMYTLEAVEENPQPVAATTSTATPTPAPNTTVPVAVSPAATVPPVSPAHQSTPVSSNNSTSSQNFSTGGGVHRTSSYTGSSNSTNASNQGTTGLGRATTYSASGLAPRPTFAPPTTPPPNRIPSTLAPQARPPAHPPSPLPSPPITRPAYSLNSSTSSLSYLSGQGVGSGSPVAHNMPLPGASPNRNNAPLPPGGFTIPAINSSSGYPSTHPNAYSAGQTSMSPPIPAQSTTYSPAPAGPSTTPSWNTPNPQAPGMTSGYFNAGTNTSYGAGSPMGAQASGIVSNPTWGGNTSPVSPWPNSSPQPGISPNSAPGFAPSMHVPPPSVPPPGSSTSSAPPLSQTSSYPSGPPVGPPSFPPPQSWNSTYHPGSGSNSGPPTPFGGAGYYPSGSHHQYTAPPFPPRPFNSNMPGGGVGGFGGPAPGQPGGFVAPPPRPGPAEGFLGGFVKQTYGVVDRIAGENTRIQLEKGMMSVAESGQSLLGKFTKKPA